MADIDTVYDALNEYSQGIEIELANAKDDNAKLREALADLTERLDAVVRHNGAFKTGAEWDAAQFAVSEARDLLNET